MPDEYDDGYDSAASFEAAGADRPEDMEPAESGELRATLVSSDYAVELTREQWDKLLSLDFLGDVHPALKEAGAIPNTVEYGGHFGRVLYFSAYSETGPERVLGALAELLTKQPEVDL